MLEICGCIIGGKSVCNLRYADDNNFKGRMGKLASAIERHRESFDLKKINEAKTNMMALNGICPERTG